MQVAIDKFGRVLIPKVIRRHLGIKPGSILQIEEHADDILLKLVEAKSPLERKQGVLVFTGEATEDLESVIQQERERRLEDLS